MADKKLILDFGSGWSKCGFEGDIIPYIEFQSIIGYPIKKEDKKPVFGSLAILRHSTTKISYPIKQGIVCNWDDMEKVIENTFYNKVKVEPMYHDLFITETSLNTKENKKKLAEIMFEKYNIPSINISNQQLLAMYDANLTTGTVIDMGDDSINIVPVVDGKVLQGSIMCLDFGGRNLTGYLAALLTQMGFCLSTINDHQLVRGIKEKLCIVELDPEKPKNTQSKSYIHPGCDEITIDSKFLYGCPEAIFRPSLMGIEDYDGLHQSIYKCIMACEEGHRNALFSNILLAGGTSMFPGIKERLEIEISKLLKAKQLSHCAIIIAPKDRKLSAWMGASKSLSNSKNWITKEEFTEKGINY